MSGKFKSNPTKTNNLIYIMIYFSGGRGVNFFLGGIKKFTPLRESSYPLMDTLSLSYTSTNLITYYSIDLFCIYFRMPWRWFNIPKIRLKEFFFKTELIELDLEDLYTFVINEQTYRRTFPIEPVLLDKFIVISPHNK